MKTFKKVTLILVLIFAVAFIYRHYYYFPKRIITGTYINTNYKSKAFLAEIPYIADTLTLYEDNKFTSSFYGKGIYKISQSYEGVRITLFYNSKTASITRNILKQCLGKPKIMLDENFNHYYLKQ